jgi:hypothetical protein
VCEFAGILAVCVVLAVVVLVVRDAAEIRQERLLREQRPLEDQIAEIRANAVSLVAQLEATLNQRPGSVPEAREWIEAMLAYSRRLESLAAQPEASVADIECLAEESARYIKDHRLKGFFVAEQAKALAALAKQWRGA